MQAQNSAPKRIWLIDQVCMVLIDGLRTHEITVKQCQQLAQLVYQRLNTLTNENKVAALLNDLAHRYSKFSNLKTIVMGMFQRKQEKQVAQQLSGLIKQGQANQAVQIAKTKMG